MRFVLDTNEYIGAVGMVKNPLAEELLVLLAESSPQHSVHIPRTIINETRRNLPVILFSGLTKIIHKFAIIDEDIVVPFELGAKYETKGLKAADAFIAAYAE